MFLWCHDTTDIQFLNSVCDLTVNYEKEKEPANASILYAKRMICGKIQVLQGDFYHHITS